MKTRNIIKTMAIVTFSLLLSTSIFAQDKPAKKDACCSTTDAKHKCTDECKTLGCDAVKAKEGKTAKHVCTDECKTIGCAAVDAKNAKAMMHKCDDNCKANGCSMTKASYECPMKCEPASDKPGECSKCGMKLKKKA